jgi:hypothetical protein
MVTMRAMANPLHESTPRWLDTASGRRINLSDPTPESISVDDIAGALSRICRFGGHTREFYSVAQHSVLVANMIAYFGHPDLRIVALHHDSHETYLGDMPTPLKKRLRDMDQYFGYEKLKKVLDIAIGKAFDIPIPVSEEDEEILIKADRAAFQMEAKLLLPSNGRYVIRDDDYKALGALPPCPAPLMPREAAQQFSAMHWSLTSRKVGV